MQWSLLNKEPNRHLFETFRQLIKLRNSNTVLQTGPMEFFYENERSRVLAFSRGEKLVVIVNLDPQAKAKFLIGPFPKQGTWKDYLSNEQIQVDDSNNVAVDLLPFDSRLYIKPDRDWVRSLVLFENKWIRRKRNEKKSFLGFPQQRDILYVSMHPHLHLSFSAYSSWWWLIEARWMNNWERILCEMHSPLAQRESEQVSIRLSFLRTQTTSDSVQDSLEIVVRLST